MFCMDTSGVRLRRNNETAVTLVIIITVVRGVLSLLARKHLVSSAWLVIQIVLCVALIGGCLAMYKLMEESELLKFIACGGFILVSAISVFNNNEPHNIIPLCAVMIVTLTYLDETFSAMCAAACEVILLIKTIIMFVKVDTSTGGVWLFGLIFFGVMAYVLYVTASNVVRIQRTDQQEIQYHLMYQEEVTSNMVGVVENGNQHIAALQTKLDGFRDATDEVTRSVDAISHGVTETALNIENQTDMTAQIQGIIDQLINVKDQTLSSADQAVYATETGGKLVSQLKEKSDAISVANQSVTEVASELQEKIASAEEITQLIYQVSSQTNLLALNASIEAARAGEAGRGFSVVADEIRKLADNTKQSIDKITELLQGITQLSNQTMQLVNNSVQASEAQASYIDEVTSAFASIAGVVDELHSNMTSLDSLSTNLSDSNNVIIDSLMNQQAASEEMAANAQSSAQLTQNNLDDLIGVIGELNQIAKIIGSLRDIEGMDMASPAPQEDHASGFVPPSPEALMEEEGGFVPPSPEELMEEEGGFIPPSPEELMEEEGGFIPPSPEALMEEEGGFIPPSPEALMEEEGGFIPPAPESLMDDDWGERI